VDAIVFYAGEQDRPVPRTEIFRDCQVMRCAVDFIFRGDIECSSFIDFARHRAGRLDLALAIGNCDPRHIALTVEGQKDLVDMFEMACSLGPCDCIILDISRATASHGGQH
jgi:hypothetical protein